jgi:hypothetical protein
MVLAEHGTALDSMRVEAAARASAAAAASAIDSKPTRAKPEEAEKRPVSHKENAAIGVRALRRALKPYQGDLFSQRGDYSGSLVYLSRYPPNRDPRSYKRGHTSSRASTADPEKLAAFLKEFDGEGQVIAEEERTARTPKDASPSVRSVKRDVSDRPASGGETLGPGFDLLGQKAERPAKPSRSNVRAESGEFERQPDAMEGSLAELAGASNARRLASAGLTSSAEEVGESPARTSTKGKMEDTKASAAAEAMLLRGYEQAASLIGEDGGATLSKSSARNTGVLVADHLSDADSVVSAERADGVGPLRGTHASVLGGKTPGTTISANLTTAMTQGSGVLAGTSGPATGPALRRQCAIALRDMSKRAAARPFVLAEGAQSALLSALQEAEDDATRMDCLAALCNLTAVPAGDAAEQASFQVQQLARPASAVSEHSADSSVQANEEDQTDDEAYPDPTLDPGVVSALTDFAKVFSGAVALDTTDAEVRRMLSAALCNVTAVRRFRNRSITEGIVPALMALMESSLRSLASRGSAMGLAAIAGGIDDAAVEGSTDAKDDDDGTIQSRPSSVQSLSGAAVHVAMTDAFALTCCLRGFCNLSGCARGSEALLASGIVSLLATHWDILTENQRGATTSHIIYNLSRVRASARKVAEEGGVLMLRDVILASASKAALSCSEAPHDREVLTPEESFVLRRTTLALSRLTRDPYASTLIIRSRAVVALGLVPLIHMDATPALPEGTLRGVTKAAGAGTSAVRAIQLAHAAVLITNPDEVFSTADGVGVAHSGGGLAGGAGDGAVLSAAHVNRQVAAAFCRLSWRNDRDVSASHGVGAALAKLVLSLDGPCRKVALTATANFMRHPVSALSVIRDGLLSAVTALVMNPAADGLQGAPASHSIRMIQTSPSWLREAHLAILALHNASCHESIREMMLKLREADVLGALASLDNGTHLRRGIALASASTTGDLPLIDQPSRHEKTMPTETSDASQSSTTVPVLTSLVYRIQISAAVIGKARSARDMLSSFEEATPSRGGAFPGQTPAILSDGFQARQGGNMWDMCVLSFALATLRNLTDEHRYRRRCLEAGVLPPLLDILRPRRLSDDVVSAKMVASVKQRPDRPPRAAPKPTERDYWDSPFPLHCVADSIHTMANLARDASCRLEIARGGVMEALVPVAEDAPSSVLAVALKRAQSETIQAFRDRAVAERKIREAAISAARLVAQLDPGAMTAEERAKALELSGKDVARPFTSAEDTSQPASAAGPGRAGRLLKPSALHFPTGAAPTPSSTSPHRRGGLARSASARDDGDPTKIDSSGPLQRKGTRSKLHGSQQQQDDADDDKMVDEATISRVEALAAVAHLARTQCALALSSIVCADDDPTMTTVALDETESDRISRLLSLNVLPALSALCRFGKDDDPIRARVVRAMSILSQTDSVAHDMLQQAGLLENLVRMLSSSVDGTRREAVAVICNLSKVQGLEMNMVQAGVVRALMVAALLRTHDAVTQTRCIQALHNLLASSEARPAVLREGVIWALQRLALSPDRSTQRACAVTLHQLATDKYAQGILVREGGLRSVISVLLAAHQEQTSQTRAPAVTLSDSSQSLSPTESSPTSSPAKGKGARVGFTMQARATPELERLSILSVLDEASKGSSRRKGSAIPEELAAAAKAGGLEPSARPLSIQDAMDSDAGSDPVVGSHFAGVLAAVSREPGHEAKLVAEGAVEALVLLCNASFTEEDATTPVTPGAGMGNLRPSCAVGLYNLSVTPNSSTRARVVNGGTPAVFVRLALSPDEDVVTRRLSVLGLAGLMWSSGSQTSAHCKQVLEVGAMHAIVMFALGFSRLASPPGKEAAEPNSTLEERFVAASILHFLSLVPEALPYFCDPAAGAIDTLAWLSTSATDVTPGMSDGVRRVLSIDTAWLAMNALANLALFPGCAARILVARAMAPALVLRTVESDAALPVPLAQGPPLGDSALTPHWLLPVAVQPKSFAWQSTMQETGSLMHAVVKAGQVAADHIARLIRSSVVTTDVDSTADSKTPSLRGLPSFRAQDGQLRAWMSVPEQKLSTSREWGGLPSTAGSRLGPPSLRALLAISVSNGTLSFGTGGAAPRYRAMDEGKAFLDAILRPWKAELAISAESLHNPSPEVAHQEGGGSTAEVASQEDSDVEALQLYLDAAVSLVSAVAGNCVVAARRTDEILAAEAEFAASQEDDDLADQPFRSTGSEWPATPFTTPETFQEAFLRTNREAAKQVADWSPRRRRDAEVAASDAAASLRAEGRSTRTNRAPHETALAAATEASGRVAHKSMIEGDWSRLAKSGHAVNSGGVFTGGPLSLWHSVGSPVGAAWMKPAPVGVHQGPVVWAQCTAPPQWLADCGVSRVCDTLASVGCLDLLARSISPQLCMPRIARLRAIVGLRTVLAVSPVARAAFVGTSRGAGVRAVVAAAAVVMAECTALDIACLGDSPNRAACVDALASTVSPPSTAASVTSASTPVHEAVPTLASAPSATSLLAVAMQAAKLPSSISTMPGSRDAAAQLEAARAAAAEAASRLTLLRSKVPGSSLWGLVEPLAVSCHEQVVQQTDSGESTAGALSPAVPSSAPATGTPHRPNGMSRPPSLRAMVGLGNSGGVDSVLGSTSSIFGPGSGSRGVAARKRSAVIVSSISAEAFGSCAIAEIARLREELVLVLSCVAEEGGARSALVLAGAAGALIGLGAVHDQQFDTQGDLIPVGSQAAEEFRSMKLGASLERVPSPALIDPRVQRAALRALCNLAIATDAALNTAGSKRVTSAALAASAMRLSSVRAQVKKLITQRLRRLRSRGALPDDSSPQEDKLTLQAQVFQLSGTIILKDYEAEEGEDSIFPLAASAGVVVPVASAAPVPSELPSPPTEDEMALTEVANGPGGATGGAVAALIAVMGAGETEYDRTVGQERIAADAIDPLGPLARMRAAGITVPLPASIDEMEELGGAADTTRQSDLAGLGPFALRLEPPRSIASVYSCLGAHRRYGGVSLPSLLSRAEAAWLQKRRSALPKVDPAWPITVFPPLLGLHWFAGLPLHTLHPLVASFSGTPSELRSSLVLCASETQIFQEDSGTDAVVLSDTASTKLMTPRASESGKSVVESSGSRLHASVCAEWPSPHERLVKLLDPDAGPSLSAGAQEWMMHLGREGVIPAPLSLTVPYPPLPISAIAGFGIPVDLDALIEVPSTPESQALSVKLRSSAFAHCASLDSSKTKSLVLQLLASARFGFRVGIVELADGLDSAPSLLGCLVAPEVVSPATEARQFQDASRPLSSLLQAFGHPPELNEEQIHLSSALGSALPVNGGLEAEGRTGIERTWSLSIDEGVIGSAKKPFRSANGGDGEDSSVPPSAAWDKVSPWREADEPSVPRPGDTVSLGRAESRSRRASISFTEAIISSMNAKGRSATNAQVLSAAARATGSVASTNDSNAVTVAAIYAASGFSSMESTSPAEEMQLAKGEAPAGFGAKLDNGFLTVQGIGLEPDEYGAERSATEECDDDDTGIRDGWGRRHGMVSATSPAEARSDDAHSQGGGAVGHVGHATLITSHRLRDERWEVAFPRLIEPMVRLGVVSNKAIRESCRKLRSLDAFAAVVSDLEIKKTTSSWEILRAVMVAARVRSMSEHSHIRRWIFSAGGSGTVSALEPDMRVLVSRVARDAPMEAQREPFSHSLSLTNRLVVDCRSLLSSPHSVCSLALIVSQLHSEEIQALVQHARVDLVTETSLSAVQGEKPQSSSSSSRRRMSLDGRTASVNLMLPGLRYAPVAMILASLPTDGESEVDVTSESKDTGTLPEGENVKVRAHSPVSKTLNSDSLRSSSRSSQRSRGSSIHKPLTSPSEAERSEPTVEVVESDPKPKTATRKPMYQRMAKPSTSSFAMRSLMTDTPSMHLQREKNRAKVLARKQQQSERKKAPSGTPSA